MQIKGNMWRWILVLMLVLGLVLVACGDDNGDDTGNGEDDITEPIDEAVEDVEESAEDVEGDVEDAAEAVDEAAEDVEGDVEDAAEDVDEAADDSEESSQDIGDEIEDAAEDVDEAVDEATEDVEGDVEDAAEDVDEATDDSEESSQDIGDEIEDAADDVDEAVDEAADDVGDEIEDIGISEEIEDAAEDVDEAVDEAAEDVESDIEEAAEDVGDEIDDAADDIDEAVDEAAEDVGIDDEDDATNGIPTILVDGTLTVDNQFVVNGKLYIRDVSVEEDGHIMIYNAEGDVIGIDTVTADDIGEHVVAINSDLVSSTIHPVLQDIPVSLDESIAESVEIVAIDIDDQFLEDNLLHVSTLVVPENVWLVARTGDRSSGPIVGHVFVESGESMNLTIELTEDVADETSLWLSLHQDTGEMESFEYQDETSNDQPLMIGGTEARVQIWTIPHIRFTQLQSNSIDTETSIVRIDSVLSDQPAQIAVYGVDADGQLTDLRGVTPVANGLTEDLEVVVDSVKLPFAIVLQPVDMADPDVQLAEPIIVEAMMDMDDAMDDSATDSPDMDEEDMNDENG